MELTRRIPSLTFLSVLSVLFVSFKQLMVTLVLRVQLLQLTLKAWRGTWEGTSCLKVCTLLKTTAFAVAVQFYFVLRTRGICLLLDRESQCSLYLVLVLFLVLFFLIFEGLRLAMRRTEKLELYFLLRANFLFILNRYPVI